MLERRGRLPGGLADGKVSGRRFELMWNFACPENSGRAIREEELLQWGIRSLRGAPVLMVPQIQV